MPYMDPPGDFAGRLVSLSAGTEEAPDRPIIHVVDHDAAVRDALSVTLKASGFAVRTYDRTAAFLKALPLKPGGCVLMELDLDDMSAAGLLIELSDGGIMLPVVLMSARLRKPEINGPELTRIDDILQKPFGREELLACLHRMLRRS